MIILDKYEQQLVLLCKCHFTKQYPSKGRWSETLKPFFKDLWGWNPDEDNNYNNYLRGSFNKLLDLYLKIKDDWTGCNGQLKDIFYASFSKGISNDEELPIERAIHALCALIQGNTVIDEKGNKRYELH